MVVSAVETVRKSWVQWALKAYEEQMVEYQKYEDYYFGDHVLAFSTDRWEAEFGIMFEEFSDNWCQVVADAPAQRLEIIGWDCDDKKMVTEAQKVWDESHVDQEEDDLHVQTFVKGDGYVLVWPNPDNKEKIDFFFNDAMDINVVYDPENKRRIIRGSKKWEREDGTVRLNIYHPTRIEQYVVPKDEDRIDLMMGLTDIPQGNDLPEGWINLGEIENPYNRVPIFHFKNRAAGSTHGTSELKTVIPIQNAVNKVLMDMMVGSEFAGFPQKWMAGSGHPKDGWKAGANRVWATTDPGAKFGQFDTMDFDGPRNFVELLVGHIAKTTQTPMHFLRTSGDMPSGEALKVAESGLIQKCKNRQKIWGHTWSEAMTFALEIKKITSDKELKCVWKSPETRHDLEQAQVAQLKSILGVPLEQLWVEHFGYTEDQVALFMKQNKQIAAAALAQLLAQPGQVAPGASGTLADLLGVDPSTSLAGLDIPQVLALLGKGKTAGTTAGEATVKPQANSAPPSSPTRRSVGFKD